ncbi:unnamed protein product [Owenia fusiformis]|uniref:Uncharacterized protein n=1 Tax=Owenia fusiformis TaxID=6347 RepID=A0A8J1XTI1_OWEFU|nr:unnamed protein product [Owenia fusiformis]
MLRSKGYDVTTISRSSGQQQISWYDLEKDGLPDDCGAVVSMAGENILNPLRRWNEDYKKDVRDSRIKTTKALAQAIIDAKTKPDVFVSLSGVGYYKPDPQTEYTEDSPGGDFDFLSRLGTDWEKEAQLPDDVPVRQVIIRSGVVLGRDGGAIQQMFLPFYAGVGGRIGCGTQWFPWIHVHDMAGIITHAIENKNVTGVLNGVAPSTNTNNEFTQAFASALWRPAFFPLPGFVVDTIFGRERGKILLEGQKVIPKRTLESGYEYIYPDLDSACAEFAKLIYKKDEFKENYNRQRDESMQKIKDKYSK